MPEPNDDDRATAEADTESGDRRAHATRGHGADGLREAAPLEFRFAELTGAPLDGTASTLRGRGKLYLADRALRLAYRRPMAELPQWAVGIIVGGGIAYYALLVHGMPELGASLSGPESGPIVPSMTAALVTWGLVRLVGPRRAEELRLTRRDVQAVLLDAPRHRALLLTREGRLVGLQILGSLDRLRRYAAHRWPDAVHEGPTREQHLGRRAFVMGAIALMVLVLLLLSGR